MKIVLEESQENQKSAKNTNREYRRIASLAVWPFGDAPFSPFWDSNKMMELMRNLSLATYLSVTQKEKISSSSSCMFMASLTASYFLTLSLLKLMFLYSIWVLAFAKQQIRFSILWPLFHWNHFSFLAAAMLLPGKQKTIRMSKLAIQPWLKFLFNYMRVFQIFSPG